VIDKELPIVLLEDNDADAFQDALTGLYNRRYLAEALRDECNRARRYRTPLSLLIVDVDSLKQCNEEHGRQAGNEVIKLVAAAVAKSCRSCDIVARYGGDEFAVVLPDTDAGAAMAVAERILDELGNRHLRWLGVSLPIAASLGLHTATKPAQLSPTVIIERADEQLRQAKRQGKGRVTAEPAEPGQAVLPENSGGTGR